MASEKAWYWFAAGVLALGLNGAYQDGQFRWVHRLTDHSATLMERASEQGLRLMAMAEVMLGRNPQSMTQTEAALQRLQAKLACRRVEMARREVDMAQVQRDIAAARIDAQLAKMQSTMDHVRSSTVQRTMRVGNCRELSRVVVMPKIPNVDLSDLPEVNIPEIPAVRVVPRVKGSGPI